MDDRQAFLERTAGFRRIDLHWCLTLEPSQIKAFERKPKENAATNSRILADLQKTATILEGHLGSLLGLPIPHKKAGANHLIHHPLRRNFGAQTPQS